MQQDFLDDNLDNAPNPHSINNDIEIRNQKTYVVKLSFFAKTFNLSMSYN